MIARLLIASLALAACHSDDSHPEDGPRDMAIGKACTASSDCDASDWCNPGNDHCEGRASTIEFDTEVYGQIAATCTACHSAGGVGVADSTHSGRLARYDLGMEETWQVLVAGGTDCAANQHRLCVDEPRRSLLVQRLLPGNGVQSFTLPDGYRDEWLQKAMHWIANGARRPGSTPVDAGVDAPPDMAMIDPPDARPCSASALPEDDACVIDEQYGVFVAPSGSDSAAGTRAAPFATIAHALATAHPSGKRVYACAGTYAGNLAIDATLDGSQIFGGFDCGTWAFDASKANISGTGTAVRATGLTEGLRLRDLAITSSVGNVAGTSSIALLVVASENVSLFRTTLSAGAGAKGADGAAGSPNGLPAAIGYDGTPGCACTPPDCPAECDPTVTLFCPGFGYTMCDDGTYVGGGTSGDKGYPQERSGGDGGADAYMDCYYGSQYCTSGSAGANGADAMVARSLDVPELDATGWRGPAGSMGAYGEHGQGGGGGGNGTTDYYDNRCNFGPDPTCSDSSYAHRPTGGDGGTGGCGGGGGEGGHAGGASIALESVSSSISIGASSLVANRGGDGGRGGVGAYGDSGVRGGYGVLGVDPYPYETRSCSGGRGGNGGRGAAGGGGGGGASAAIAYVGAAPIATNTTFVHGAGGIGGLDGTGGTYARGSNGEVGDVVLVPGPDRVNPTGGGVMAAMSDGCSSVSVMLFVAMDDRTMMSDIEQEICVSTVAGQCATTWTRFDSSTNLMTSLDLHMYAGQPVFVSARPRDGAGNLGTPGAEKMVSLPFPAAPSWAAGNVTVTPATFRQYTVAWPAITPACTWQSVTVDVCDASSSCSQVFPSTATSQVRNGDCLGASFTVKVNDGRTPVQMRTGSGNWPVPFSMVSSDTFSGNCVKSGCHPSTYTSPKFSSATSDKRPSGRCPSYQLIGSSSGNSDIFRVASTNTHICGVAHGGNTNGIYSENLEKLRCWIDQGAP